MSDGATRWLDVTVEPMREAGALANALLVIFVEGAQPTRSRAAPVKNRRGAPKLSQVTQALAEAREDVRLTREAMRASQEELEATNRELWAANEELQSANEELTTSKEESQSMNEELQTLNHELETKLVELSRASNDMEEPPREHGDRGALLGPAELSRVRLHGASGHLHQAHPRGRRAAPGGLVDARLSVALRRRA